MSRSLRERLAMFDISQSAANSLFGLSNILTIIGGVLVVVGAIGIFLMGGIRERYADERISENEAKAASAIAESARANESNTRLKVELERERIERLRLEQKVAPRQLSPAQRSKLLAGLEITGWKEAQIIWHGAGEPETYARDFEKLFNEAGMKTSVHTLGPFIPSAWGLLVIRTDNDVSAHLARMLQSAGVPFEVEDTNEVLGAKTKPTLFVGSRED